MGRFLGHGRRHSSGDPLRDVDAYGVAEHPVADGVAESFCPAIGEALQAFAFSRCKSTDGRAGWGNAEEVIATVTANRGCVDNQGFRAAAQIATTRAERAATFAVSPEGRLREADGLIFNAGIAFYAFGILAIRSSAECKRGGRFFFRLAARRRMPAQAFLER